MDERFWGRVTKSDGCWIWTGPIRGKGYGQVLLMDGTKVGAHRLSRECAALRERAEKAEAEVASLREQFSEAEEIWQSRVMDLQKRLAQEKDCGLSIAGSLGTTEAVRQKLEQRLKDARELLRSVLIDPFTEGGSEMLHQRIEAFLAEEPKPPSETKP